MKLEIVTEKAITVNEEGYKHMIKYFSLAECEEIEIEYCCFHQEFKNRSKH